jgi:alkanesulfonate monooxygenase SsuD/methylene tetrahydromethanopterin reductase-like flavin-dependent oxidoreductase (luciferase family)
MTLGLLPELEEHRHDGATPRFKTIQRMAQEAEDAGLDTFWLADHFFYDPADGPRVGQWEAFTFLSALASTISQIKLGAMVAATSFRNPTLLGKMADSLDEISNGRFILGLGSGWHQPEYDAFGYPFDHRAARFEEALQIIQPLLREGRVDFQGRYYSAHNCTLSPRGPTPTGPQILIGARQPRMLHLVARYADAWNTIWHTKPGVVAERWAQMRAVCAEEGRDPETLELTAGVLVRVVLPGEATPAPTERHITGTPEEMAEAFRGFEAVGVRRLVVVFEQERADNAQRLGRVKEQLDRLR